MPKATFRLYDVERKENGYPFLEALNYILGMDPEERVFNIDGHDGFLCDKKEIRGIHAFVFSKVRMEDIPLATNRKGERCPLSLLDDQGLSEDVVLAFDPMIDKASIQTTGYSFRPGKIASYINHFFPDMAVHFLPIISPDIVKRFNEMKILRRLSFRIAQTTNLEFLRDSGLSAAQKIAIQEMLKAPYLEMTLSVGKGKRNLGLGDIVANLARSLADAVWKKGEDGIDKLLVAGKSDEFSKSDHIDLLSDQIQYTADVQRQGRSIDVYDLCRHAVGAIIENREVLKDTNVS